ncbi:ribonuclease H-like domain-containing protein [Tanacetum coccineum]
MTSFPLAEEMLVRMNKGIGTLRLTRDGPSDPHSLYGLKQASRAWFQRFSSYAIRAGFYHSKTDSSLFIFHKGPDTAYLLLYVNDIILTASSTSLLQRIISSLHAGFAMTDLGPLNYFLGISATLDTEKKLGYEGSPVTDPTL